MTARILAVCIVVLATAVAFRTHRGGDAAVAATPIPEDTVVVRVVHDLNRDGTAQPDEPGLADWSILTGCGDALSGTRTDDTGAAVVRPPVSSGVPSVALCVQIEMQYGWLPTTIDRVPIPLGRQAVTFTVYNLGPTIMQAGFSVIRAGLLADARGVSIGPPYAHCVERSAATELLYIIGADQRDGCPAPGARVPVEIDGTSHSELMFTPGAPSNVFTTLVVGGDSMRFAMPATEPTYTVWDADSARVNGIECGVFVPMLQFPPQMRVYVLSDEARAGCARPGDLIWFYRDGRPLSPAVPWRAGEVTYGIDAPEGIPYFAPAIGMPDTGYGSSAGSAERYTLMLASSLVLLLGLVSWSRTRSKR